MHWLYNGFYNIAFLKIIGYVYEQNKITYD
jgi:hypothetical protein